MGGSDVSIIQPAFSIQPRGDSNIVPQGSGVITEEVVIDNIPYKYAIPMLTGWDLSRALELVRPLFGLFRACRYRQRNARNFDEDLLMARALRHQARSAHGRTAVAGRSGRLAGRSSVGIVRSCVSVGGQSGEGVG
jgi:hypothetical protein